MEPDDDIPTELVNDPNDVSPVGYIHFDIMPDGHLNMTLDNVSAPQAWAAGKMLDWEATQEYTMVRVQQVQEAQSKALMLARSMPQDHLPKGKRN